MIDAMAVLIILGFIGTIDTTAGMAFWLDRKQSARMDRIEKRLDDQDVLQRVMQSDLAEVKAELEAQGERLDRQDARFDRIEKRLDDMDDRQRVMQSDLAEVKAELKAQGERLDRHDERFDRIDERFERQSGEINAVGRKVDRVEGMVYVLIHGPDYRERGLGIMEAEREDEVSEPVGDD